jgi:type II secretory pathway component PulF
MPNYRYTTRDAKGASQSGTLTAGSVEALTAELRGRGLLVVDVEPVRGGGLGGAGSGWLPATSFDAETGLQQLATMLHSGLSLLGALRTVA